MNKVKKIDIHVHATLFPKCSLPRGVDYSFICPEDVIEHYDNLNIEAGILLPLVSPEFHDETISTSAECKYISDKYPERFFWFCGLDARMAGHNENADFSKILNFYKSLGAKGVGELTNQLPVDHPLMDNLFYHCAECDMPVTIHMAPKLGNNYGIIDDKGLPRLEKMLKKHKKLKIIGHSQTFWAEMSKDVSEEERYGYPTGKVIDGRIAQLMREYENLYCDCSAGSGANALTRDVEYTVKFIEEFSDRILYGTDFCAKSNTHPYSFETFLDKMLDDGMISQENYYKFVRGNAIKLLNLNIE